MIRLLILSQFDSTVCYITCNSFVFERGPCQRVLLLPLLHSHSQITPDPTTSLAAPLLPDPMENGGREAIRGVLRIRQARREGDDRRGLGLEIHARSHDQKTTTTGKRR